jgi:hypothetical protein
VSRTCLPTSKKERERVVLNAQKMTLKGGNPAESGKKKFTSTKRPRKVAFYLPLVFKVIQTTMFTMATSFSSSKNVTSSSFSCASSRRQSRGRYVLSSSPARRNDFSSSSTSFLFQRPRIASVRNNKSKSSSLVRRITNYIDDGSKNEDMNKETQASSSSISKYYQTVALSRALTITNSTAAAGGASSWPDEDGEKTPSSIFGRGKMFVENALASFKRGINQRLEADKNFVFKLLTEICIDELITLSVLIWVTGLNSEAWTPTIRLAALVQMLSAALNDTLIVYFLAPTGSSVDKDGSGGGKPALAHVFQAGDYSIKERIGCYFAKAKFYLVIGSATCTVATFFAKALGGNLAGFFPGVFVQSIMLGGIHMSVSANTRYQIVNGIERVIYEKLPPKISRAGSVLVRTTNNFLGARLWIVLTKLISS